MTGHLSVFYERLAAQLGPRVELIHNPSYATSESMYSLALARDAVRGPFLLLESDLVYEGSALGALAAAPTESAVLVSGSTGSGDEVYVQADVAGRLEALSKDRARIGPVWGEMVGISRIGPECFAGMLSHAEVVFERTLHLEYEQALVAASRVFAVACPRGLDLAWSEIDTETQLERVRVEVHPTIRRRDVAFRSQFS